MIMLSAATQLISGVVYLSWSSTEPIRDVLNRQDAAAAAAAAKATRVESRSTISS
jgi:hypothetical protein